MILDISDSTEEVKDLKLSLPVVQNVASQSLMLLNADVNNCSTVPAVLSAFSVTFWSARRTPFFQSPEQFQAVASNGDSHSVVGSGSPSAPARPFCSHPCYMSLSAHYPASTAPAVAGISGEDSVVPDIAAAADHPYPPWRYPGHVADAEHALLQPVDWSAELFFLQLVECRLFLKLLLFYIQQRQCLNQFIFTGQHTLFICRQFFPSRSLMRCCRARSCLCASVIFSVAMPADCLAAAICPSTCACC